VFEGNDRAAFPLQGRPCLTKTKLARRRFGSGAKEMGKGFGLRGLKKSFLACDWFFGTIWQCGGQVCASRFVRLRAHEASHYSLIPHAPKSDFLVMG
jgi:hypothetical protein